MRLGRNLWLDGRSLAHMVENSVAAMSGCLQSTQWNRVLTILDQGDLGSCTGNAGAGGLGTEPFYDAVGREVLPEPTDAQAAEQFAVDPYSAATQIDAFPWGTRPTTRVRPTLPSSRSSKTAGRSSGFASPARYTGSSGSCRRVQGFRACPGTGSSSNQIPTGSPMPSRTDQAAKWPVGTRSRRWGSSSTRPTSLKACGAPKLDSPLDRGARSIPSPWLRSPISFSFA